MKVRRLVVKNVSSYRERTEFVFDSGINILIWPSSSSEGTVFSREFTKREWGCSGMWSVIPKRERDARVMAATMDHSDIRGLATAFHLFFAGLPRSKVGDHLTCRAHIKRVEGSPHRSRASRCRFGMELDVVKVGVEPPGWIEQVALHSGFQLDVLSNVPNEAGELAGDGDADLVVMKLATHAEASPAFGEAQLRLPGDVADDFRLTFLADLERAGDLRFEAIGPGRFDEDTTSVFVAAFGDSTLTAAGATGVFGRNQAQIGHECARMFKTGEIADLGDEGDGRDEVQTLQAHQRLDQRVHAPVLTEFAQLGGDTLDALAGFLTGCAVLVESDFLRRVLEADSGQVSLVCLAPGVAPYVVAPVTQQHGFHLQPDAKPSGTGIFTSPRQIAHRLVAFVRHDDGGQVAGAQLSSQKQRVAPIGFDALLGGVASQPRRGNDLASPMLLAKVTHPTVAARSCFVSQQRVLRTAALASQRLAQLGRRRVDRSDEPRRAAACRCDRNRHGVLVNIQSNVGSDRLFHGLSPRGSGTRPSYRAVHVARRPQDATHDKRRQTLPSNSTFSLTPIAASGHDV